MMSIKSNISSEFADLVLKLQQTPDDFSLKQAMVRRLPEMMALAKVNPLAMFRLAQMHPPTSSQYKQMMMESAGQGCTNAMLAMCELLVKSNSADDLFLAKQYLRMIEDSSDSYIIQHARSLLAAHPELASDKKATVRMDTYTTNLRFFASISACKREVVAEQLTEQFPS